MDDNVSRTIQELWAKGVSVLETWMVTLGLAVFAGVVWLIRLEGRVDFQQKLMALQDKALGEQSKRVEEVSKRLETVDEKLVNEISLIRQCLARIEERLAINSGTFDR
jgi:uncharacterized coiled-coil protein SlyX